MGFEVVGVVDYFGEGVEVEVGYDFVDFLCDECYEVYDVFGFVGVFFVEVWVLGCDVGWVGI